MLELDDSPGTTKRTKFQSSKRLTSIFGQMVLLITGPLIGVTVLFAELT